MLLDTCLRSNHIMTIDFSGLNQDTYDFKSDDTLKQACITAAERQITDAFLARQAGGSRVSAGSIVIEVQCDTDGGIRCCGATADPLCAFNGQCQDYTCNLYADGRKLSSSEAPGCSNWSDNDFAGNDSDGPRNKGPTDCSNYCTIFDVDSVLANTPPKEFAKALQLVFGDKPSPGLVCGISSSVADPSANTGIAGTCCVDSPAESLGNADAESGGWGQPVSMSFVYTLSVVVSTSNKCHLVFSYRFSTHARKNVTN